MTRPNLLICGIAVYDLVFNVEEIPDRATKYKAADAQLTAGGCAANAAVAAARLGAHVQLAGRIGEDLIGDLIMQHLADEQIDCTQLRRITGARSGFSSIAIDAAGERQILNFRGAGLEVEAHWLTHIQNVQAVLADMRWEAGALAAMQLARRLEIPGILDAEPPLHIEAMKLASHIAFSQEGLAALTHTHDPVQGLMQAAAVFDAWLCVTDGANGVFSIEQGQVQHTAAFAVSAVDTLGAGDVWHGAFCAALGTGLAEADAVVYANAAAALKCTRHGGGLGAPIESELRQFLEVQKISIKL